MVERLFLDGIDLQRRGRGVAETVKLPSVINTNETKTGLAFADVAMPWAEIAVHAAFGHGLPPAPLVEGFRLLEYFQFLHGDSRQGNFSRASLYVAIIHPFVRRPLAAMFVLCTAPFLRPYEEMLKSRTLAPQKTEELRRSERMHVSAKEGFEAPAKIRAGPRTQPVALGGDPIVVQGGEHSDVVFST